jgi:hypothetical protein
VEVLDRFSPPGVGKSVDSVENTAPKALNAPGRQLLKKASQSFAPAGAKGSQIIFLRRHVRRRKYVSACKREKPVRMGGLFALQQAAVFSKKW